MLVTGYGPGGPASIPGIVKDLPAQHEGVWRWVGGGGGTEFETLCNCRLCLLEGKVKLW